MKTQFPCCFSAALTGLGFLAIPTTAVSQSLSIGSASGFGLLGLGNGSVTINSATEIVGDVGYSNGVTSTINQKAENFTGSALVHSGATFSHSPDNFLPTGGILQGASVDDRLNQANADVLLLAASLSGLGSTQSAGFIGDGDNRILTSTGSLNVIDITGVNHNSDTLTLRSRTGLTDTFILRVSGNFSYSQSSIVLDGLGAENVLFYFPNNSSILINKDATRFNGTILAPNGSVDYHNPAEFNGAIIARNISVHSAFNLNQVDFVPEPSTSMLGMAGLGMLLLTRRR